MLRTSGEKWEGELSNKYRRQNTSRETKQSTKGRITIYQVSKSTKGLCTSNTNKYSMSRKGAISNTKQSIYRSK